MDIKRLRQMSREIFKGFNMRTKVKKSKKIYSRKKKQTDV